MFCATLVEERSDVSRPDYWLNELGALLGAGRRSAAGISITDSNALTISAVWAAVNVISSAIASLPFRVLEETEKGLQVATTHPAHRLLYSQPNEYMTPYTLKETLIAHCLLRGNGYARTIWDGAGRPAAIYLLLPHEVQPLRRGERLFYEVTTESFHETYEAEEIIHVKGLGYDGLQGYSVVSHARDSMGLSKAAEQYGSKHFSNGGTMTGVLETASKMTPEAAQKMGEWFDRMYSGLSAEQRTVVLGPGTKYSRVGIPPDESQFLETRNFQLSDIARWFNIPPHLIGDLSRATFSNIEAQNLSFLTLTLMPWIVRLEEEFTTKLIGPGRKFHCDIDEQSLRRGDLAAQTTYYNAGVQGGWLTYNEVRAQQGLPPIPGGDIPQRPLNMTPVTGAPTPPKAQEPPEDQPADRAKPITVEQIKPVLREAIARMMRKESKIRNRHQGEKLASALAEHRSDVAEAIMPSLQMLNVPAARAAAISESIMRAHAAAFTEGESQIDHDVEIFTDGIQ